MYFILRNNLMLDVFRLCVENGSEKFDEFLSILGEKITLKGWERFRGGLDVKGKKWRFFGHSDMTKE